MYAVISSGGKQARVEEGERLDLELLSPDDNGGVTLRPVLIVDGDTLLSTPEQLGGASVEARVVGESKGPKIKAMTYQAKARRRRRWGHRQHYTTVEITAIRAGSSAGGTDGAVPAPSLATAPDETVPDDRAPEPAAPTDTPPAPFEDDRPDETRAES